MPESSDSLAKVLLQKGVLTPEKLQEVQGHAKKSNLSFEEALVEQKILKGDDLGSIVAELHGWKFVCLKKVEVDAEMLHIIPEEVARKQMVFPFSRNGEGVKVAMANPDDMPLIHLLHKRIGRPIISFYAAPRDILENLRLYQTGIGGEFDKLIAAHAKEASFEEAQDSAIVKIVDLLLQHGYESKASDIHIEPQQHATAARFRIDGVLHNIVTIPKNLHDLVITRIKILSKLRTDEHQAPQDGKLQYDFHGELVDIRVSIVPTTKGENAVLRLLSETSRQFSLEQLGFSEMDYKKIKDQITKPWGMILATGPTGSGKTTTLYAILKLLNRKEVNIATIEDPVEYNIEGVTQIQVNPRAKLTFASGLRSIVRQDPDIIMVGEIRDEETASIAVNSGMTGHLVLSTIHTNDAATTLPRLLDMKIEPFLVASTVNIAIGQRLVRKICDSCHQQYETDLSEVKEGIPPDLFEKLMQGKSKITLHRGKGCSACARTGYIGRIGVFEVLEITDEIRSLIMRRVDADTIRKKAMENGMTTMFEDAVRKVLAGVTTVEEMLRAIKD